MHTRRTTSPLTLIGLAITAVLALLLPASPAAAQSMLYTVTSLADAGDGTLRAAIDAANSNPSTNDDPDVINFEIDGTITVNTPLPSLTNAVRIITFGRAVTLSRSPDVLVREGLSAAEGVRVDVIGLQVERFTFGLLLRGPGQIDDVHVTDNNIGIYVDSGGNPTVSDSTISGNAIGLQVLGLGSPLIIRNRIGTTADGSAARGNGVGIAVSGTGANPTISAANTISGNSQRGISISGGSAPSVNGNLIGTTADGLRAIPNGDGVFIEGAGSSPTIGTAEAPNTISGNSRSGITVFEGAGGRIVGNLIGTTSAGNEPLPNRVGISVSELGSNPVIGSATAPNIIGGNLEIGIDVRARANPTIAGNLIGTTRDGLDPLANPIGVFVEGIGTNPSIGTADAPNIISGNSGTGINIGAGAAPTVTGNLIGTTVDGLRPLPNQNGITVNGVGTDAVIGAFGLPNLVSGNALDGIRVGGGAKPTIVGNHIGTTRDGTAALPNKVGVRVGGVGTNPVIGTANLPNTISGNSGDGIQISSRAAPIILGNRVGTTPDGKARVSNLQGILISGEGSRPTVGAADAPNIISGNTQAGISVREGASATISGNRIGTTVDGRTGLANGGGILVTGEGTDATIGTADSPNTISGNQFQGVFIGSRANATILGNRIGIDGDGLMALPNRTGIEMSTAGTTTVGTVDAPNTISGNTEAGIAINANGDSIIAGNMIGTDSAGTTAVPNRVGVVVSNPGTNPVIGTAEAPNTISGNELVGIQVLDGAAPTVLGNVIGTDSAGTTAVPNRVGVAAVGAGSAPSIGLPGSPNTIAGNTGEGVLASSDARPVIRSNRIGGTTDGADLGNGREGIAYADGEGNPAPGPIAPPVITTALKAGSQVIVSGTTTAPAGRQAIIDVFASGVCDPTGAGEGARPLGSTTTTAGENGTATWSLTADDATDGVLTATTTTLVAADDMTATSAFSTCATPTTATTPIDEAPAPADLQLDLQAPQTGTVGRAVDLTATITNRSATTARDATVTLNLPDRTTSPATSASCTTTGQQVRCPLGTLRGGTTQTITIPVTSDRPGPSQLTATVTSATSDPTPADNTDTVTIDVDDAPDPAEQTVTRLDHDDPIDSAIEQAATRFPAGADTIVLARDDVFADALAAAPLTADAPLLLTGRDDLDPRTAAAIDRLTDGDGEVLVLGGPNAISTGITDQLTADGLTVTRLFGPSRVQTALAIADRLVTDGADPGRVVIARHDGEGTAAWADAITVGPWAAHTTTPILLTPSSALDADVGAWMDTHDTTSSIVLGGTAAVSDTVLAAVPDGRRIGGPNRYATAAAITTQLWADDTSGGFQISSATDEQGWAHALVAAGTAATDRTPQLLAERDRLPAETDQALGCTDGRRPPILLLGATTLLGADLETQLRGPC